MHDLSAAAPARLIDINPAATVDILGTMVTPLLSNRETGNQFGVFEAVVPPGAGIPPHTHADIEFFFALEGELTLFREIDGHLDQMTLTANHGGFVPSHALHGFINASSRPARLLITCTSGLEEFLLEAGIPAASSTGAPPEPSEIERVLALARKHGQVFPPPRN